MSSYLSGDFSNFDQQQWELALKDHLNGNIEKFATHMADKTTDDLHFDFETKILSCGKFTLKLSDLMRQAPFYHEYLVTPTMNDKIKHLADCIEMKIFEETFFKEFDSEDSVENVDTKPSNPGNPQQHSLKRGRKSSNAIVPLNNENVKKARIQREGIQALNASLWHSFLMGDLKACKEAIRSGANPNMQDMLGNSLLMLALQTNNSVMVDFLIQMKADVNLPNIYRETPLIIATKNSNISASKQLLSHGADPTARDNTLNTALHYAILNNCDPLFELLLDVSDLNAQTIFLESPLHLAVGVNNIQACQALIDRNVLLDGINTEGVTPLMHAINYQYLPIVNLLIDRGAILEAYDGVNRSLLMQKGSVVNFEIFKKLIDAGCDAGLRDSFGFSIMEYLKGYRPTDYKERVNLIKAKQPELKAVNKEIQLKKMVAHAWDLEGTSPVRDRNQEFSLPLTGGMSAQWAHQMQKNIDQFCQAYPDDITDPDFFRQTLLTSSGGNICSMEEKLSLIKQGFPVFFNSGFYKHAVTILIWGDRFIICNRGTYSRTPLDVFHFDNNSLNLEHLNMMTKVTKEGPEEYQRLFFNELAQQLNFVKTDKDLTFEYAGQLSLPYQTVGNCSWASIMASIYAFFWLSELRKEGGDSKRENIEKSDVRASQIFENWEDFQKIFSFRSLLIQMKESKFQPDSNLLRMVEEAAFTSSNRFLIEERNKLMQLYEQDINKQ